LVVGSNGSAILMRGKSATCRQTLPLYPEVSDRRS